VDEREEPRCVCLSMWYVIARTLDMQNVNSKPIGTYQQKFWGLSFLLVLLYVLFEFGGPNYTFSFLRPLRVLLILTVWLAGILFTDFLSGTLYLREPRIKLVLLFWVLMGLHIPLAVNNMSAFGKTQAMLPYVVLFLAIASYTNSIKRLVVLINLWLFLHLYQSLHAIMNGGEGVGGYISDENDLALTLVMAIPVAYFLFMGSRGFKRIFYAACLFVILPGLVFSFSRGGFVGLVAGGIYCLLNCQKRLVPSLTIALLAGMLFSAAPTGYWERMNTIKQGTGQKTAENRVYLWKVAWRMFLGNPLWGVGPGSFRNAVSRYQPEGKFYGRSMSGRAVHSAHFQLLSEFGLPGLIIFTLIVYRHFRSVQDIWKHRAKAISFLPSKRQQSTSELELLPYIAIGFGGALVSYLVAASFVSVLYYPQFWVLSGIMVAIHQVWNQQRAPYHSQEIPIVV